MIFLNLSVVFKASDIELRRPGTESYFMTEPIDVKMKILIEVLKKIAGIFCIMTHQQFIALVS